MAVSPPTPAVTSTLARLDTLSLRLTLASELSEPEDELMLLLESNLRGIFPSSGRGSSSARLQMASNVGMLDMSSAVMCSPCMSAAPELMRTPSARFMRDMMVANIVASMPGGHSLAASTMVGIDRMFCTHEQHT